MSIIDKLNPYSLAIKLAGIGIALFALFALVMSWSARGQEIARLTDWRDSVVNATTAATVEPNAKGVRKTLDPSAVPAAIAGLKRSADSCLAASAERDRIATDAKARADRADAALANANVLFNNEYASAQKRIDALAAAKTKPTPELKCQAIGTDSKAAWEGWK